MIVRSLTRWIIALALVATAVGFQQQNFMVTRFAVACLLWIGLEWVIFRYRVDVYVRGVQAKRELRSRQGPARVLWETRPLTVLTRLDFRSADGWLPSDWLPAMHATVHDLIPSSLQNESRDVGTSFALGQEPEVTVSTRVRPSTPGTAHFSGLRLVIQDQHGFFQAERFIELAQDVRILPLAIEAGTIATTRKSKNVLPPPGEHLMPKAGMGSELMDIRDYIPGDPPRSIAWKVSARRATLMSKQFETEVPVRCQMLVDMSRSMRLGYPGPCLGGRLVSVLSSIASTLVTHRDQVGLSIFDGEKIRIWRASAARKTMLRMIDGLTGALSEPIPPVDAPIGEMLRAAYDIARVRYPEATGHAERRLSTFIPARVVYRMKMRMAAILCNHYGLDEAAMGELVDDERSSGSLSYWLQRFLTDHGSPYTGPLFDSEGNYLFDDHGKIEQLAKLVRRVAMRGRDNELILIAAELTDADYDLSELTRAIRFARARHHRVAILLAWPPNMPTPKDEINLDVVLKYGPNGATESVLEKRQKQHAFLRIRSEMGKLRVPVAIATADVATNLVLSQLEILRMGRTSV